MEIKVDIVHVAHRLADEEPEVQAKFLSEFVEVLAAIHEGKSGVSGNLLNPICKGMTDFGKEFFETFGRQLQGFRTGELR